jgi:outer membrane protein assembly factor BamB
MAHRLESERREERRTRPAISASGEGWIATGAALIVIASLVNPAAGIAIPVWIFAICVILAGTWQLRGDAKALRVVGTILASSTVLALAFVGFRAIQATGASPDSNPSVVATPTVRESTVVAGPPDAPLTGNIAMQGATASHDSLMPGPPPSTTPSLAWQLDTGGEVYGAPVLVDGILYVVSKFGTVLAVDATSGETIWTREVTGYVTRASPAVVDGIVYVGGGFTFTALDAKTGDERWSIPVQYIGHTSPTIAEGLVIVSSQERWIYGIEAESGTVRWRLPTEGIVFGAVAMTGNAAVYATDEGIIYSASLDSGRMIWRQKVDGSIYASPVISQGRVLVSSQSGQLHALSLDTGSSLWSSLHGSPTAPATNGDVVVVSASDGGIYGLDMASGEQRWLYPSGKTGLTAPAISENLALVGAGNSLLAIDIETGEAVWYYLAGDRIESSPVIADGHVFFGSRDGFLSAVAETP